MHLPRLVPVLLALTAPLVGCDPPPPDDGTRVVIDYREAWSEQDNPSLLDPNFNYTFAQLPTHGSATKIPWAGSYWPTYQDSINVRWDGPTSHSAAKKYELAFGRVGVEDAVSAHSGVDSLIMGAPCTSDAQCDPERGSICARRHDRNEGRCSETWFGLCHAWAPAALLEHEPIRPVLFNGVEFKINDLKALMTLSYTGHLEVRFMSLRCNEKAEGDELHDLPHCRDTNPGSFHVVVANLLGLHGQSFIEDRTFDYEVWNQPVRSFQVTRDTPLTGLQANQLLGAGEPVATVEHSGLIARDAWRQVHQLAVEPGQSLSVQMTGTGDADLYVRWNAQPSASDFNCRPYLDATTDERCDLLVPTGAHTAHIAVHGFGPSSQYTITTTLTDPASATYAFNPDAVSLRQIQTELRWIGESDSSIDGNLAADIDQYTGVDIYDYVLELDAAGKIIGGEWLGDSRTNHPDFLWLPMLKRPGTVARVHYGDVRHLFDLSTTP